MLDKVLNNTQSFYFSYNYDLTHTLERTHEFNNNPQADKRFLWNSFLLKNLNLTPDLSPFGLPLILGFFSINRVKLKGKQFEYSLVSRRSCLNAGTRFNARGTDAYGNVANFVETEQIVYYENTVCSYVIIRGSIPLNWTNKTDLKYKPPIVIGNFDGQLTACQKHFTNTQPVYKQQVCVNLINHHGAEGLLEVNFNEVIRDMKDPLVRYEAFDFHKQCGKSRWDRLDILMNTLANDEISFEYFSLERTTKEKLRKKQRGVFRVNCIDCLDRTNVVQGLLAKRMLRTQFVDLKILSEHETIETNEEFYSIFRNVWADNGDSMSAQYAGTGALKSDFTRLGKRTFYGLMRDGNNSIIRYFLNNFYDGFKQDSMDLMLGNYEVKPNEGAFSNNSPLSQNSQREFVLRALLVMFLILFFILFSILVSDSFEFRKKIIFMAIWLFVVYYLSKKIIKNGRNLVNQPRLYNKY